MATTNRPSTVSQRSPSRNYVHSNTIDDQRSYLRANHERGEPPYTSFARRGPDHLQCAIRPHDHSARTYPHPIPTGHTYAESFSNHSTYWRSHGDTTFHTIKEDPQTSTSLSPPQATLKPSRSMPNNAPPHAKTSTLVSSNETVHSKTKGGDDSSNGHPAPAVASSPHPISVPTAERRLPTPPRAAVAQDNPPTRPRVDPSRSEHSYGTGGSRRGRSESGDVSEIICVPAVTAPSLTPPPKTLLRPLNDIVREHPSTSSLAVSISNDGIALSPKSTGVERGQSSGQGETMSKRGPPIEHLDPQVTGVPDQNRDPTLSLPLQPQIERGFKMDILSPPPPTSMEKERSPHQEVIEEREMSPLHSCPRPTTTRQPAHRDSMRLQRRPSSSHSQSTDSPTGTARRYNEPPPLTEAEKPYRDDKSCCICC